MDRGYRRDPYQASTQAEDGSPGCTADSAVITGRSLSADLGSKLGESGSAATAVAPTSNGASPHADHEPTASGGAERRPALQQEVVAGSRTGTTGGVPVSPVGELATARPAGVAGSTDANDCRADASHRAGSGEMSRGAAVAHASRGGRTDSIGLRADHRESGSVPVWQADRELSGAGAVGGVERKSATVGTYHETGQLPVALPAGGSGASDGAQHPRMAQ